MKFFHSFALATTTLLPLISAAPSPVSHGYGVVQSVAQAGEVRAVDTADAAPVCRAADGYRNAAYFVNW